MNGTPWSELPPVMRALDARPLLLMRLRVAPSVVIGAAPGGARRVAGVEGGTFEGADPDLSGHVHPGGVDWLTEPDDGSTRLDARVVLETGAGDTILMAYRGVRHGPADVLARLARGEVVEPGAYYFRTAPVFETASKRFGRLNRIVAVGIGQRLADGVRYSVFEVA